MGLDIAISPPGGGPKITMNSDTLCSSWGQRPTAWSGRLWATQGPSSEPPPHPFWGQSARSGIHHHAYLKLSWPNHTKSFGNQHIPKLRPTGPWALELCILQCKCTCWVPKGLRLVHFLATKLCRALQSLYKTKLQLPGSSVSSCPDSRHDELRRSGTDPGNSSKASPRWQDEHSIHHTDHI